MQEQALQPHLLAQALVDGRVAVLVVAGHGMADVLGVHADLVGAAGLDADLAVGMPAPPLKHAEMTERGLAIAMHLYVPLPTLAQADALAREFGQGGTLCWSTGEPVRLRMMWPRPSEAGDDPYTDWVG